MGHAMARLVRNPKLDTRTARAKLPERREPYWSVMAEGCAIGYRRGARGGTWVARWRDKDGKQHYDALGPADDHVEGAAVLTFAQAQEKARERFQARANAQAGLGPAVAITVAEACRRYIAYLKAEAKTAKDAEQRLNKHVLPVLGERVVSGLSLTELEEWRNALVRRDDDDPDMERRSKDTANRLLNYLKAAFNRLMLDPKNGITDDRAWRFLKPFEAVGQARQVHLDPAQIARLMHRTSGAFNRMIVSALLTGCRAGELKAMKVQDFHANTGTLHVSGGKTGKRDVVLTDEGVRFFREITAGRPAGDLLLVRDDGSPWAKDDHHRPMAKAVTAAELPADTVFYSLRHTYASQALMAGMNVQLLAENLGTSVTMIERHYGKFTKVARRQMIQSTALNLGLEAGNVIKLRG